LEERKSHVVACPSGTEVVDGTKAESVTPMPATEMEALGEYAADLPFAVFLIRARKL
jgi:hypothetical protein